MNPCTYFGKTPTLNLNSIHPNAYTLKAALKGAYPFENLPPSGGIGINKKNDKASKINLISIKKTFDKHQKEI